MASPDSPTILLPGGLVLVTGVNGFLGSHIASVLLRLGYAVRGTVRSADKAAWITKALSPKGHFEAVVVPDLAAPGALESSFIGVEAVVHVATDMSFGADPNAIITPMIASIRNVLQTAAKSPSLKRFVLTSSNRAALNPVPGKEYTINASPELWNEEAIAAAWRDPPYEADRIWDVYAALKAQTEQELWKFTRDEKPNFVVNSVLPDYVVGPILDAEQGGSTGQIVKTLFDDPSQTAFLQSFIPQWFVDVEDTALLHIAAMTQEDVKNERLWGFGETFNFNSWLAAFRNIDPSKAWPADDPDQQHDLSKIDTARELELLARFGKAGWTSFDESVRRCVLDSAART